MNRKSEKPDRWGWMFWAREAEQNFGVEYPEERETLIYSPNSYFTGDAFYVVVQFKLESRDWWLCRFDDKDGDRDTLNRIQNYKRNLREAMVTCYSLNKLLGYC